MGLGGLRLPHWYCRGVHAITESSNKTGGNKLSDGERGALKGGADDHDARTNKNRALATKLVSKEDGDDCAKEASKGVTTDRDSLDARGFGCAPAWRRVGCVDLRE